MTHVLTIQEYADRIRVDAQTVRRWAREGKHPFGARIIRANPESNGKAVWRVEVDVPTTGKEDDS